MERFIDKEVTFKSGNSGIVKEILKEEETIKIEVNGEIKEYDFMVIRNEIVKFNDEALEETALKVFNGIEEEKNKAEDERLEKEIEESSYQQFVKERLKIGNTNVAIKCTFNNGGASKDRIGYAGVCSKDLVKFNTCTRTWCKSKDCKCRQLVDGLITQKEFDDFVKSPQGVELCYESNMLVRWDCRGGVGSDGKPMAIERARTGSLCVLTTRPVIDGEEVPQEETIIFGCFLIGRYVDNTYKGGALIADPKFRIELTPDEAKQILFWNYHSNTSKEDEAAWACGLHRYLSDMECAQILNDMVNVIKDSDRKVLCKELLDKFLKDTRIDEIQPLSGALKKERPNFEY